MDLSGSPQFTFEEIQPASSEGETIVIGRLSHLRGVRNTRGFLYRSPGPSVVGDLAEIPHSIEERVECLIRGMKRQVLFIQGGGARVHGEWDNKLVDSLKRELGPTYAVRYPRMPNEDDPNYATWKAALQKEIVGLNDGAILVGHSIGGTIMINALAEQPPTRRLGAIFLISVPFVGEGGWPPDDWKPQRELGKKLPRGVPIYIYQGLADQTAPPAHADLYARAIPQAKVHRLPGRDHQLNNDLREVAEAIKTLAAAA